MLEMNKKAFFEGKNKVMSILSVAVASLDSHGQASLSC